MSDTPPPAGALPQSTALSETETGSLAEAMSRDPEGLSRQDRDRIVEALRAHRQRLQIAEATAVKAPRAAKISVPLTMKAGQNPEDLDL
jgi:hypothetical protein